MAYDLQLPEKDLPMISAVATQALQLINRPNVTNNELNDLIRQDPSLAGRVLHIANSPFYGGRFQARRISDAIVRMGMRQLRNILVVAATGELFDVRDPIVRGFWDHALTVATLGDRIASELSLADTEEVFIAGLLHDIGKFIIYQQHPAPYSDVIQQAQASGRRLIDVEDELFKYFNHVTIGGIAIRRWKLADAVAETARYHHVAEREIPPGMENTNLVCVVTLANVLVKAIAQGEPVPAPETLVQLACVQQLRLTPGRLAALTRSATEWCPHAEGLMALEA